MKIKVQTIPTTSSADTSSKTTTSDIPEKQSFQEVLVLNQTALKAMAIDAMVKESSTGAVNPDSVDAAAIMKFRGTLGPNIKAPIPEDDMDLGKPIKVNIPPAVPTITKPATNQSSTTTQNPVTNQNTAVTPNDSSVSNETTTPAGSTTPSGNTPIESPSGAPILDEAATNIAGATTGIPNTGVLECSDELNQYFQKASEAFGVDVKLLKCIAYAESNFNPNATSRSGAMGVMQLMPKTAEGLGVRDGYDAEQNILGGAKYISIQLKRFDGNIEYALAAYNAGPNRVQQYGGIPPYEETQNYVKKIMNVYNSL